MLTPVIQAVFFFQNGYKLFVKVAGKEIIIVVKEMHIFQIITYLKTILFTSGSVNISKEKP